VHPSGVLDAATQARVCPAARRAGLDGLRIHDLRHTAVALWIAAGANPKEVAARAGHASVSFTLDRYGHLSPEADLTLRERLDAMFAASQVRDS
jgi:integrase